MANNGPVLLKLSGEALGLPGASLNLAECDRVGKELVEGTRAFSTSVGVVVGGGNILRGANLAGYGNDPTRPDRMGMMATVINALAIQCAVERAGGRCLVVTPHAIANVSQQYERDLVMTALGQGWIVVFGGGTGHPFLTTDTAAALRAAEIGARVVAKASQVAGVYTADPRKDPTATLIPRMTFDEAISGRYAVMDQAAFAICRERSIPIRIFDLHQPGALIAALGPTPPGSLIGG